MVSVLHELTLPDEKELPADPAPAPVVETETIALDPARPLDGPTIECAWLRHHPVQTGSRSGYETRRRMIDLTVLAVTAPAWGAAMLLVAAAIKLEDPHSPVLYAQPRTGRNAQRFTLFKFRTMRPDADELKMVLRHLNQRTWPDFKVDPDPRITRVGRLLRRTSLDELPQLLNIARGEMTLVGPRPTTLPPERYLPWQLARFEHAVGLTGVWQIAGRAHPSFAARVRLDLDYNQRASTRLDVEVLVRTIGAVVTMKGG